MDIAFLRAIASLENTNEPFCIIKKDLSTHVYSSLSTTYCDISQLPDDVFATGYQNYDSESGHWCVWNQKEVFDSCDETIKEKEFEQSLETINWKSNIDKSKYIDTCKLMIEEMERGEYFLANLTRKIEAKVDVNPIVVAINSAFDHECEFRYFFHSPEFSYLSLSPERFISIRSGVITSQPIKGTASSFDELDKNVKDREENTMVVDLVRADFSKVAVDSTITVSNLQKITTHPGLVQMSSAITASLNKDIDIKECIKALMPIASVSGTPKPRVIKKIAAHENFERGIYCGALGWIDTSTNECDLSVAIRGIQFENSKVTIGIGAGITHKSVPENEFEETELKASRITQLIEKSLESEIDSIFSSMRVDTNGHIFAFSKHLKRLEKASEVLGIDFEIKNILTSVEKQLLNLPGKLQIKINKNNLLTTAIETNPELMSKFRNVGLTFSTIQEHKDVVLKSEPRNAYTRMFEQGQLCARDDVDEVIIIKNGEVKESTRCNIFVRFGNQILTPPLDASILNGVMRQVIVEQFDLDGLSLEEKIIRVDELVHADEIVLTNSVRGASSIAKIDSLVFKNLEKFDPQKNVASDYFEELFISNFEAPVTSNV